MHFLYVPGETVGIARYGGSDNSAVDKVLKIGIAEDWVMETRECKKDLCNGSSSLKASLAAIVLSVFIGPLISWKK